MKDFLICAWILTVFAAGANAENLRVRLRAEVIVQGKTLRLSDLLPDKAGAQLKAAAESLSLGPAPEIGSLRVFSAAQLSQTIAEIPVSTAEIEIPKQVVVRRIGCSLETENIARTLAHSKLTHALDFLDSKIMLPPGFTTAIANPEFEVTALHSSPEHHRLQASMRCRERSACGSFLVEVLNVPIKSVPSPEPGSERIAEPSLSLAVGPVLVHRGRLALLVIEGNGIRITQPVMPLKAARLGEVVRVSDPVTHRVLITQVSGDGLLRTSSAIRKEEVR
jgi:hypothetical protein